MRHAANVADNLLAVGQGVVGFIIGRVGEVYEVDVSIDASSKCVISEGGDRAIKARVHNEPHGVFTVNVFAHCAGGIPFSKRWAFIVGVD